MLRVICAIALIIFCSFLPASISACGYNYIGDCSTVLYFNVNGTPDSFSVADCTFGTQFHGIDLGEIKSLTLPKVTGATWESCYNNVTGMVMYYRLFPTGNPNAVNFQPINLPEDHFTIEGPYTTRYRSVSPNMNLTNGLTVGQKYTFEVYFKAMVDTVGDDFIPEFDYFQNRNGQNYQMTFTYGGVAAPPFTVSVTKIVDVKCAGDSTGLARVSVYGDKDGLFYNWAGVSNNFFARFNLPMGIYPLTVSGASGYSKSLSIEIGAQSNMVNSFAGVTGVDCQGNPGSATAMASGGVLPYAYAWNTTELTPTAHFSAPGYWWLTVSDAIGCTKEFYVDIPASGGTVERSVSASICAGTTYNVGGNAYAQAGSYTYTLSGQNACDTLVYLTLSVSNPADLLQNLPSVVTLTCFDPSKTICIAAAATFIWERNGMTVGTDSCFLIDNNGDFRVFCSQNGCTAQKSIAIIDKTALPTGLGTGYGTYSCGADEINIALQAYSTTTNPQFEWVAPGNWSSQAATAVYSTHNFFAVDSIRLRVINEYGCSAQLPVQITIEKPAGVLSLNLGNFVFNCDITYAGSVAVSGGTPPYVYHWDGNVATGASFLLSPGNYSLTVTDNIGCSISTELVLNDRQPLSVTPPQQYLTNCDGTYSGTLQIAGGTAPYSVVWSDPNANGADFKLAGGNYTTTVTDANNCVAITTLSLQPITNILGVSVTALPATGANQANGAITAAPINASGPVSYIWDNGCVLPNNSNLLPGNYCVTIIDAATGCTQTACGTVSYVIATNEAQPARFLEVNPNPAQEMLQIKVTDAPASSKMEVAVLSQNGKILLSQTTTVSNGVANLIISDLPSGAYMLRVTTEKEVVFGKFIKI